jgi:NHL repeat-containing protein
MTSYQLPACPTKPKGRSWVISILLAMLASGASAAGFDELKVKREGVFEFAQKPVVTIKGDKVTITFTSKAYCDVTVAVENADGKIVRHLASGVLGKNAPPPFKKNSHKQVVVWDGKSDKGGYIDDKAGLTVRVSLGLKPVFEKRLYWSPHKRGGKLAPIIRAAPEGVYVFETGLGGAGLGVVEGRGMEHLRLFSHKGDYLRTIYPFPARKLGSIKELTRRVMPQTGKRYPLRNGLSQYTFLTSGALSFGKIWPTASGGPAAVTMAVNGGRIALINKRLNRLSASELTMGYPMSGPKTSLPLLMRAAHGFKGGIQDLPPWDAVFDPTGKTLYLAGYYYETFTSDHIHAVTKMDYEGNKTPQVFVGSLKCNDVGTGDKQFNAPVSVACDSKGRVYVADHFNHRIQVFTPDAKLVKTIPVKHPAVVRVHQKTGEIYVLSWFIHNLHFQPLYIAKNKIKPMVTHMGALDNPKVISRYPLEWGPGFTYKKPRMSMEVDSWAESPTVWLGRSNTGGHSHENWDVHQCRILVEKEEGGKRQFVVQRDFAKDVKKTVVRTAPPRHGRSKVFCNPANGKLYVAESYTKEGKSFKDLIEVDPDTGSTRLVQIPFHSEDMAFDLDGHAYLRSADVLARYDSRTWREIPFDYGEQRKAVGFSPHSYGKYAKVASGVPMPSFYSGWWHFGGMYVSPKGNVVVTCYNSKRPASRKDKLGREVQSKPYTPKAFPGRLRGWEVHVWDKYGQVLYKDAIPGSSQLFGVGMDRKDNIYSMTVGRRIYRGKPYFNDISCMVFKAKPKNVRVLSAGSRAIIPLAQAQQPKRQPDMRKPLHGGDVWFQNAEWFYGGVGNAAKGLSRARGGCWCDYARMMLDSFARTFVPEPDTYSIAVLDPNGNLILRLGEYGNVDDGVPSKTAVPLFLPRHLATHTDRRLFISDIGNAAVMSVKLDYHATETVNLKGKE